MKVINSEIKKRLKGVHNLSRLNNGTDKRGHEQKLLELMRHHIDEIEELYRKDDKHFLVETGDLIVLCMELLLENGVSVDNTFLQCIERYENKLNQLINERK